MWVFDTGTILWYHIMVPVMVEVIPGVEASVAGTAAGAGAGAHGGLSAGRRGVGGSSAHLPSLPPHVWRVPR